MVYSRIKFLMFRMFCYIHFQLEITAGNNICCMRNNPQQCHLVATAGNENTLRLWSLERPASPIFTAKNVCRTSDISFKNFWTLLPVGWYKNNWSSLFLLKRLFFQFFLNCRMVYQCMLLYANVSMPLACVRYMTNLIKEILYEILKFFSHNFVGSNSSGLFAVFCCVSYCQSAQFDGCLELTDDWLFICVWTDWLVVNAYCRWDMIGWTCEFPSGSRTSGFCPIPSASLRVLITTRSMLLICTQCSKISEPIAFSGII